MINCKQERGADPTAERERDGAAWDGSNVTVVMTVETLSTPGLINEIFELPAPNGRVISDFRPTSRPVPPKDFILDIWTGELFREIFQVQMFRRVPQRNVHKFC